MLAIGLGPVELAIILFILGLNVFWIAGLISAATFDRRIWEAARQDKMIWILVQIFTGIVGALIYLIAIRPKLKRVEQGLPAA